MAKISKRKAGATALAVSMLTGTAVANAANIIPKNPVPAGSCLASQYHPGLGCPDWADEFDGTEVNKDFWNVYNGYSEVNQDPYGRYTKDAVTVRDGKLHLTTKVGANGQKGESAEMSTNNKAAFEDGYWEFKVSSYSGFGHVGGYLYGNGNVAGPQQGEIDGYEAFGSTDKNTRNEAGKKEKFDQSNKNQSIIHYSQNAIDAQTGKKVTHGKATWFPNKPVGEPVVVGILKTADGVKIFRDGVLVQEMKSTDPNYAKTFPAGQPLNTTLTARVSNVYWGLQSNPTGGISFDYVRHYPLVTVSPSPSASPTTTTEAPKPVETVKPTIEASTSPATPEPSPTPPSPVETTAIPSASPTPTVSVTPTVEPQPTESPVAPSATPTVDPKPTTEVVVPEPTIDAPKPVETTAVPTASPEATPTEDVPKPSEPAPSATATSPSPVVTATPSSESTAKPSAEPSPSETPLSPSPSASESASPSPVKETATAEVTIPSSPSASSSEKSSNDLVPKPSVSPSQQASASPSTEGVDASPEGDDALKNKSGDRVVDSSNPSSIKGSDTLSTPNDSVSKPKQPVVAQTGHDAKSGGWVTAGIAAIVVGVIAVAGWFLLFKSRNGNDGQE